MAYKIVFTKEAVRDIERVDATVRRQLHKKFLYVAALGDIKTVAKKLHNHDAGGYRLRVGSFRIIFDLAGRTLIVLRVQHRKDVYR